MTTVLVLLLALAFAAVTWVTAWWGVLVVALLAGALWKQRNAAGWCALAAALGWSLLLVVDAMDGRLGGLARVTGAVMRVPGVALVLITLLFATAAAWSAATVGREGVLLLINHPRRGASGNDRN